MPKPKTDKKCIICGAEHYAKDLCALHYARKRKGVDLTLCERRKGNEHFYNGECEEFVFYDKNHEKAGTFLVDVNMIRKIESIKWSVLSTGYIAGYPNGKTVLLHRFITDCPKGLVVDHINHNKLDNRMNNLRICTQRQNTINKRSLSNTGEFGIHRTKHGFHIVQIDGKYCGCATNLERAIQIRNEALKGSEQEKYNSYL